MKWTWSYRGYRIYCTICAEITRENWLPSVTCGIINFFKGPLQVITCTACCSKPCLRWVKIRYNKFSSSFKISASLTHCVISLAIAPEFKACDSFQRTFATCYPTYSTQLDFSFNRKMVQLRKSTQSNDHLVVSSDKPVISAYFRGIIAIDRFAAPYYMYPQWNKSAPQPNKLPCWQLVSIFSVAVSSFM